MKTILILGAGRSSASLIHYLLEHANAENYRVCVADLSIELAREKTGGHPAAEEVQLDITNEDERARIIEKADLVVSLLPPALHIVAAKDCLRFRKSLVTASYVSPEIVGLDADCRKAGLLFLNECGLDPGIDHMSAMQIIHRLQNQGAALNSFKSFTGGLISPESNDNPWGYKFTWNPRNVILAGQGTARYIQDGKYRYIPYSRLFSETELIEVKDTGEFDGYANRDSLVYRKHYGIENIPTLLRGTLRYRNFCAGWHVFVSLGMTDDSFVMENTENMTYSEFTAAFIPASIKGNTTEERLTVYLKNNKDLLLPMIKSAGLLDDIQIGVADLSPAGVLLHLLQQKWRLNESDLDMVVMQHRFEYSLNNRKEKLISSLVVKGESQLFTAMAKTVGLPLGIAARKILNGSIALTGVKIPVDQIIYEPVMRELESMNIIFREEVSVI